MHVTMVTRHTLLKPVAHGTSLFIHLVPLALGIRYLVYKLVATVPFPHRITYAYTTSTLCCL